MTERTWRQALADDIVRRIFDRIEKDRGIHKDSLTEEAMTALMLADAHPSHEQAGMDAQIDPRALGLSSPDPSGLGYRERIYVTKGQMEHLKRIAPDQVAAGYYAVNGPIPMTAEECLRSAAEAEQASVAQGFIDVVSAKLSGSPEFQKLIEDLHIYGSTAYTVEAFPDPNEKLGIGIGVHPMRPDMKFVAEYGPDKPVTYGKSPGMELLEASRKIREMLPPTPKPVSVPPTGREGWKLIGYVSAVDGKFPPGAYYLSTEIEIPGAREGEQHGAYVEVDDLGNMWRVPSRLTKGTICVFRERGPVMTPNHASEDIPIIVHWSGKHDGSVFGKLSDQDKDTIARYRAEMDAAWKCHERKVRDYVVPSFTHGEIGPSLKSD